MYRNSLIKNKVKRGTIQFKIQEIKIINYNCNDLFIFLYFK